MKAYEHGDCTGLKYIYIFMYDMVYTLHHIPIQNEHRFILHQHMGAGQRVVKWDRAVSSTVGDVVWEVSRRCAHIAANHDEIDNTSNTLLDLLLDGELSIIAALAVLQ